MYKHTKHKLVKNGMRQTVVVVLLSLATVPLSAQMVGINTDTPHKSSALDINTTNKGFLPPRVNLASLTDTTTIAGPAAGLMIYEPDGFTETVDGQPVTRKAGIYVFNGGQWERLTASGDGSGATERHGLVGVKINVQQSGYITLSGYQSYGLLMQNQGVSINPVYVSGAWPPQSSQPSDVISGGAGDDGARLLENPVQDEPDFYRINFNYRMGNNTPTDTRYFTVSFVSVASGATVYSSMIVVPGGLNTGHIVPFQVFFPSLADSVSIGNGYRLMFGVDTAGSDGLPGNIDVELVDIVRIN